MLKNKPDLMSKFFYGLYGLGVCSLCIYCIGETKSPIRANIIASGLYQGSEFLSGLHLVKGNSRPFRQIAIAWSLSDCLKYS